MVKHGRYAVELNSAPARVPDEASKRQQDRRVAQELSADMSQIDRFKQMARELECDEDEEAFKEKVKQVIRQKPKDVDHPKEG